MHFNILSIIVLNLFIFCIVKTAKVKLYVPQITTNITEQLINIKNNEEYKNVKSFKTSYLNLKEKKIKSKFFGLIKSKSVVDTVPLENPFKILYNCKEDVVKENCDIIKIEMEEAVQQIKKAINIYRQIIVEINVYNFCNENSDSNCISTIATTQPPSFMPIKLGENEPEYFYPQGLVKQLIFDEEIEFTGEYDIQINLNGNTNLKNLCKTVLIHEIIHGLGMFTNSNVFDDFSDVKATTKKFIAPNRIIEDNYNGTSTYERFSPISIYEKYLVEESNPNVYLYDGMLKFKDIKLGITYDNEIKSEQQIQDLAKKIEEIENNESVKTGEKLYNLFFKADTIAFRTNNDKLVQLQTFNDYYSINSVLHTRIPYYCARENDCITDPNVFLTEDFVMYSIIAARGTVEELTQRLIVDKTYGILGPNIPDILATLGWTKIDQERNMKKYYVNTEDFIGNGEYFKAEYMNNSSSSKANSKNKSSTYLFRIFLSMLYTTLIYYFIF